VVTIAAVGIITAVTVAGTTITDDDISRRDRTLVKLLRNLRAET
jgi:hypothetical protein